MCLEILVRHLLQYGRLVTQRTQSVGMLLQQMRIGKESSKSEIATALVTSLSLPALCRASRSMTP